MMKSFFSKKRNFILLLYVVLCVCVAVLFVYACFSAFYRPPVHYVADALPFTFPVVDQCVDSTPPLQEKIQKVLINKANLQELMTLPGIGEKTAIEILNDRNSFGPFFFPEDLLNVKGIGPNTLKKILPYLLFEENP
ncbi:MAG: hypothetical protein GX786_07950 [Clostridiales bacterium]|nr:hypothetical protein [Clostridiales bacterium]